MSGSLCFGSYPDTIGNGGAGESGAPGGQQGDNNQIVYMDQFCKKAKFSDNTLYMYCILLFTKHFLGIVLSTSVY